MARNYANLIVLLLVCLLLAFSCARIDKRPPATPSLPTLRGITDPIVKLGVRLGIIGEAAPENKVVQTQTTAAKADLHDADQNIEAVRADFERRLQEKDEAIAQQAERAEKAESQSHFWYNKMIDTLKILAMLGMAGGVFFAFMISKKWIVITGAAAVLLGTILLTTSTEKFVELYGLKIVAGIFVAVGGLGVYGIWRWMRSSHQLVKTGDVMKTELVARGADWLTEIAPQIEAKQGKFTKWVVDRFYKREAKKQAKDTPLLPRS